MPSNLHPGADYADFDDLDWTECWDCGGSGYDEYSCECEAFEDTCCCAEPTPRKCSTCFGKGGWTVDHSAEDQALQEAENDSK
jgi:hypothetical protein